MAFNSLTFLLFFLIISALYALPMGWGARKGILLVGSYLFYAAWNPPFVLLLWLSTVVDWYAAKGIARSEENRIRRRWLILSLLVNLGLLGFFKYANFAAKAFTQLLLQFGVSWAPPEWNIILPVGISFYTFQSLSYTIDVYRRTLTPAKSFRDFALYVTFFPQLVAGPIVRAVDFLPQLEEERRANRRQFGWGLNLLLLGLFQKIVVADGVLAPIVESVFDNSGIDGPTSWTGAIAFSGQIFFDFSGYSTCAIGVALCLGFALPDNFRFPYAAIGFSDFWKRWHITLSSWLRDYLYIPLGGNRGGALNTMRNLLVTMLLGGLWHGAGWTFLLWGLMHGALLVIEHLIRSTPLAKLDFWHSVAGRGVLIAITFLIVSAVWIPFRASNMNQTALMLASLVDVPSWFEGTRISDGQAIKTAIVMTLLIGSHVALRNKNLEWFVRRCPLALWSLLNAIMIFMIFTMPGEDRAFIYFQF